MKKLLNFKQIYGYKTLFFGSNNDLISQTFLNGLLKQKELNLDVITTSDRVNKNQSLDIICQKNEIQCIKPFGQDIKKDWQELQLDDYELAFICSFGYMIPEFIIDKIKKACIVVHPSLLPKYRGASPIQYALLNNDENTGTSFILTSKNKFDAGKIILQKQYKIKNKDRYLELSQELTNLAVENLPFLIQNLDNLIDNSVIQDESLKTLAPKLDKQMTYAKFQKMSYQQIYNIYRAIYGTNFKYLRCKFQDQIISLSEIQLVKFKLLKVPQKIQIQLEQEYVNIQNGALCVLNKQLYVKCVDGWLCLKQLNLSSGKQLSQSQFRQMFFKDQINNYFEDIE